MNSEKIVTRFAPSPTGFLHLGAYRTAIYSYLFARKNKGTYVLRIEDTDKERNKKEFEDNILESLKWLGLEHDIFYRQSEHVQTHKKYLEKMISDGFAYISKEEAKDGSGVIKEIIRYKNPNIDVTFHDEIKGEVTMNTTDLGDFVIAKNLEEPLFHLAVVIDDFEAGITHVIRGEDHTSNTPRQILIQRAIGASTPIYAHLPLVLGPDKLKLSKRRGALPITAYQEMGFLPEAILNGVAFVGWNPGTEQEIFTHDELVENFDLARVQKSPAVFNEEKLKWFNREHMKLLSDEDFLNKVEEFLPTEIKEGSGYQKEMIVRMLPLLRDKLSYFGELNEMHKNGELEYFFSAPTQYDKNLLIWKELKNEPTKDETTKQHIYRIVKYLEALSPVDWNADMIKSIMWPYAEEHGKGNVFWPIRVSLSGREKSPDPFILAFILGKDETLKRLQFAHDLL